MLAQLCELTFKGLPPIAGETLHSQKGNLLFTKWHDKRDVNILSTNVDPFTPPVLKQKRKKHGEVEEVEKPYCVEQYNKHMGGVGCSDELRSYSCPAIYEGRAKAICLAILSARSIQLIIIAYISLAYRLIPVMPTSSCFPYFSGAMVCPLVAQMVYQYDILPSIYLKCA